MRVGKGGNMQGSKMHVQSRPWHNMHRALQSVRQAAGARVLLLHWREVQPLFGHSLRKQVPLNRRLSTAPKGGHTNAAPRVQSELLRRAHTVLEASKCRSVGAATLQ